MKYVIIVCCLVFTLVSCAYFDPMHGLTFLDYGDSYSLTFSGESAVLLSLIHI